MNFLAVIAVVNQMEASGVIGRYAIGGAVGATFYLEPAGLQTGRSKDKARLLQFIENGILDPGKLELLVDRHGLLTQWRQFQRRFLN